MSPGGSISSPILPGIWRVTCGRPEAVSPVATRSYPPAETALAELPQVDTCPVPVSGQATPRGYVVSIPLGEHEQVYGLGLQLQSFAHRNTKKTLRVNADPRLPAGDSHAPVPFYVTTGGYGVLIDTARYATFYCGNDHRRTARAEHAVGGDGLPAAYHAATGESPSDVLVEIPHADGVDVYVFAGPSMRAAIQRSNLFAGGGALPPLWGLGVWYRTHKDFDQDDVWQMAETLRDRRIPCDVLGLEPGWQTHTYSCSYVWSKDFPDPKGMIEKLRAENFRLNLWEHAFVHPTSPLYERLTDHAGDFSVWGGLVPDFVSATAREEFADFHRREHVCLGVSGYKLDECDNSDFTGGWSFPELSTFPSGVDGEQMHCLFGRQYQDAITSAFDGEPTYGLVRSAHALAAPYPYVLYSDLYDHRDFVRGVVNSGFSGLLWTPELRHADSPEDLLRRLQTVVLSPLAHINAWYLRNPPWMQTDPDENNAGRFDPSWPELEARCRRLLEFRMQLLPYLQAAFVGYQRTGAPPFRALVVDWPDDPRTWMIDDQYLVGDALLVAPMVAGQRTREVYLPGGTWFDFWTGTPFGPGRHSIEPDVETIPLFVRAGTAVPLAEPSLHATSEWTIHVRSYGDDAPDTVTVYPERDGTVVETVLGRDDVASWSAVTVGSNGAPAGQPT